MICWMPENSYLRTPSRNEPVKGSKTRLKSAWQHFQHNVTLISTKLSYLSWVIVESELLGSLFTTLTVDHIYSCDNWQKVSPITSSNAIIFKTIKILSKFYCIFKIYIKFWAFLEKLYHHSFNMSDIIDSEKCGYLNALKLLFQNTLWKSTC